MFHCLEDRQECYHFQFIHSSFSMNTLRWSGVFHPISPPSPSCSFLLGASFNLLRSLLRRFNDGVCLVADRVLRLETLQFVWALSHHEQRAQTCLLFTSSGRDLIGCTSWALHRDGTKLRWRIISVLQFPPKKAAWVYLQGDSAGFEAAPIAQQT